MEKETTVLLIEVAPADSQQQNFLAKFRDELNTQVALADGQKLATAGVGERFIECTDDKMNERNIMLTEVLSVPELRGNLISVNKFVN